MKSERTIGIHISYFIKLFLYSEYNYFTFYMYLYCFSFGLQILIQILFNLIIV